MYNHIQYLIDIFVEITYKTLKVWVLYHLNSLEHVFTL